MLIAARAMLLLRWRTSVSGASGLTTPGARLRRYTTETSAMKHMAGSGGLLMLQTDERNVSRRYTLV